METEIITCSKGQVEKVTRKKELGNTRHINCTNTKAKATNVILRNTKKDLAFAGEIFYKFKFTRKL